MYPALGSPPRDPAERPGRAERWCGLTSDVLSITGASPLGLSDSSHRHPQPHATRHSHLTSGIQSVHPPGAKSLLAASIAHRIGIMTYRSAFCGEESEIFVDPSAGRRPTFTEDGVVCCRPNLITPAIEEDGDGRLHVTQEYEA